MLRVRSKEKAKFGPGPGESRGGCFVEHAVLWIREEQSEGEEELIQQGYEDIERGKRTTKVKGRKRVERVGS